jgi:tetratricopeptide (TPR) repeat protein
MMSTRTPAPFRSFPERQLGRALLCVLCFALMTGGAAAQSTEAQRTPPSAAIEHYNRGREHYQAGRYREALAELEQAVRLDPASPNLVFNVARVYELLGEIDHAIAFYRRYRDMLPASEQAERERTTLTLQRLEGARGQLVTEEPAKVAPSETKHGVADPTFWTVASLGALTLAGAGVVGYLALDAEKQSDAFVLGADGSAKRREKLVTRADHLALAGDTMLVVGATLTVAAVLLYVLREQPVVATPARPTLDLKLAHGGAYLVWKGQL